MGQQIWNRRVLIPLWFLQLVILTVEIGIVGFALWAVKDADDDGDFARYNIGSSIDALEIILGVFVGVASFTMLLTFVEVVLYARRNLYPIPFMSLEAVKAAIWAAFLGLSIYAAAIGNPSALDIFLNLVMFITSVALFSYGANILKRLRNGTLSYNTSSPYDETKA